MIIDLLFLLLMALAIFKGYTRGLVVAVFSVIAMVAGLAAALKLSVVTAAWLKDAMHIAAKWLPVLAFILVFVTVVLLVRLGAIAIEKTMQLALLGWANRIGGILLYMIVYTLIMSVALFYADKLNLLSPETIAASRTYSFIKPWGPTTIEAIGKLIPFFKNMFQQLEVFFARVSDKITMPKT